MAAIEQLKAEYDGEWLAINVTASENYEAIEVELLYHSRDHDEVWRKIGEIPREIRKDYDIKVCYAGPLLAEGIDGMLISIWATPEQIARLSSKAQE